MTLSFYQFSQITYRKRLTQLYVYLKVLFPIFFGNEISNILLYIGFAGYNISFVMIESNRSVVALSGVLAKIQEYYALQPKATFWFGAVLSLLDHHHQAELIDDLPIPRKVELIKLITHALASLTAFYEQEKPNSIFRLFNFMGIVIELSKDCKEYAFVVVKVVYLNALALYSVKIGQYSYALEVYGYIIDIFNQGIIDSTNEVFLTALSNYLSLLKKSSKKMTSKLLEVQGLLKQLFFKYLTKLMFLEKDTNFEAFNQSLTLLSGVFSQHRVLLASYEKDLNSIIAHFYQNSMKMKRKIPENMIEDICRQKVKKNISFKFALNQDELLFYSGNKFKALLEPKSTQMREEPEKKMLKMEAMLEKTIQMLQEQKLNAARAALCRPSLNQSVTLSNRTNHSTINRTIDSVDLPTQTIENQTNAEVRRSIQRVQPLPRSITKKRQALMKQPPKVQKCNVRRSLKFKIYSIFLDVYEDGILLSDYTNENKKYIQWNTVSLIMERFEGQFVFEDSLKCQVQNFYDVVRIFAYYLTKNDNRQICLLSKPIPLLEINSLVRLYKQEGKYLKLALMNQYDTDKYVGVIDCYISQYSEYFRQLSQNQYLGHLNDRFFSANSDSPIEKETFYHLDYLKRYRQTTVAELSKMFEVSCLEAAIQQRGAIYKCLFLLKNNLQLLVRIVDNIKVPLPEDYRIELKIETLERFGNEGLYIQSDKDKAETKKFRKNMEISLRQLTCYFPVFDKSLKDYLTLYSKMIVDCLNNFEIHLTEVNMAGLAFQFIIHTSRTEMIEYGKYYSVVTAELIGSKERVWALVIKFYDLAFLNYKITVLMNPYHDFLEGIINSSREQQAKVMKNLLIGQSLRETVSWLKKSGKMESRMNLFEYLYANRLI